MGIDWLIICLSLSKIQHPTADFHKWEKNLTSVTMYNSANFQSCGGYGAWRRPIRGVNRYWTNKNTTLALICPPFLSHYLVSLFLESCCWWSTKPIFEPHPKIIHSISTTVHSIPCHFIHSCWRDATHHPEFLVFLTIRYECLAIPSNMCVCVCFFLGGEWGGQTFTLWCRTYRDYIYFWVQFF
jgi:hypothetical protein